MNNNAPHPIDLHVGAKVRLLRKSMKVSQADLAKALDLTFQQVQKYELGTNRISASKLWEISQYMKVPLGYFFDDYDDEHGNNQPISDAEKTATCFLKTTEGIELAQAFPRVINPDVRRDLLRLVRSLANSTAKR
jgi:transcriptional regulator with XRE-family HTH domain